MKRHVLYALAPLLLALAIWPPAALAAPEPGSVFPETGTPGTRFVFLAGGFGANERLSMWANTPDGRVVPFDAGAPEQAASDGSVSWNWVAPAGFQPGTWQFVVHGRAGGAERVFSFGVNPPANAAPAADYNIQPAAGRPGDLFRFYATGFSEGEDVSARAVAPGGASLGDGLRVDTRARAGGRVDGFWAAPPDVPEYGVWRIVLVGAESGVERAIPLTIEPAPAQQQPAPRVSPQVGRPGLAFIFEAAGFQPGEPLSAWVNTADGRIVAVEQRDLNAAADGSARFGWSAPQDAAPGGWSMVVHGRKSAIEQVIAFQILPAS
jgi:hypothetical protein